MCFLQLPNGLLDRTVSVSHVFTPHCWWVPTPGQSAEHRRELSRRLCNMWRPSRTNLIVQPGYRRVTAALRAEMLKRVADAGELPAQMTPQKVYL